MFGMSFGEILIIAIIGIVFLGPEKLPKMMVQVAKFFNSFKRNVAEVKDTLNKELEIDELKQGALDYKDKFESAKSEFTSFTNNIEKEGNDIRDSVTSIADINENIDNSKKVSLTKVEKTKVSFTKEVKEVKKDV